MDRNQMREAGAKAQALINAGNHFLARADQRGTATTTAPAAPTVMDPAAQEVAGDIAARVEAEDQGADEARYEGAAAECYQRGIDLLQAAIARPPVEGEPPA